MARTFMRIFMVAQNQLQIPRDQIQIDCLDTAFRTFWDMHPWRESLGTFAPFYLIPSWQRYVEPYIEMPSDFRDLYSAEGVEISTSGPTIAKGLNVIANLENEDASWATNEPSIGYSHQQQAILISNPPSATVGRFYIQAKYKKDYPVDLTADNASSTNFPMERHEQTFLEYLKWIIQGGPEERASFVGGLLRAAKMSETPGAQDQSNHPDSSYSNLGT